MANPAYGVSGETIGSTVKPVGPGMLPGASFFFCGQPGTEFSTSLPKAAGSGTAIGRSMPLALFWDCLVA